MSDEHELDTPSTPPDLIGFNIDGYYYLTSDFNSPSANGGPTWKRVLLSELGISVDSLAEHAFSPTTPPLIDFPPFILPE